jgi:hypothetical protein
VRRLALILIVLAGLAGCGDDGGTETAPDGPLVVYSRTGGFAPVIEHLTVERGGEATLETGFAGSDGDEVDFTLSESELSDLTAAVEDAPLDEFEAGPGACADCYEYSIEAGGEAIELSDADMLEGSGAVVPNEVFELLDQLGAIVEEHKPATD